MNLVSKIGATGGVSALLFLIAYVCYSEAHPRDFHPHERLSESKKGWRVSVNGKSTVARVYESPEKLCVTFTGVGKRGLLYPGYLMNKESSRVSGYAVDQLTEFAGSVWVGESEMTSYPDMPSESADYTSRVSIAENRISFFVGKTDQVVLAK